MHNPMHRQVLLAMRPCDRRDIACATLQSLDYDVCLADSAKEAIAQLGGRAPNLVITRQDLADGFDAGLEIVRHVKEHYRAVPVAILSSGGIHSHIVLASDVHRYEDDIMDAKAVAPLMERIAAETSERGKKNLIS